MIDLHSHSSYSDGWDAPEEIAALADQVGLSAVALTDHDTLEGLDAFMGQQCIVSARLVPGIELSCEFVGRDLHVLGLFIDHRDTTFRERVWGLQRRREKRNVKIFENLRGHGVKIPEEPFLGDGPGLLTRGHIADMLLEGGYGATRTEVFHKYLGEDGIAYAPFEFLSPRDAFAWVREAGGLPVVAHPGRFTMGRFVWDKAMAHLKDIGAGGIEAHYPDHCVAETAYFLGLCETLDMAACGGSDYHGRYKPGCMLGVGWGNLHVPDRVLEDLLGRL